MMDRSLLLLLLLLVYGENPPQSSCSGESNTEKIQIIQSSKHCPYLRYPTAVTGPASCCPSWSPWGRSRPRSWRGSAARRAGARSAWWCWSSRRPAPRWPALWTSTPCTQTPSRRPCLTPTPTPTELFFFFFKQNFSLLVSFCFLAHEGFLWGAAAAAAADRSEGLRGPDATEITFVCPLSLTLTLLLLLLLMPLSKATTW